MARVNKLLSEFSACCLCLPPTNALFVAEVYRCIQSGNFKEALARITFDSQFRLDPACYMSIIIRLELAIVDDDFDDEFTDDTENDAFGKFIDAKLFAIEGDKLNCDKIPNVYTQNLYTNEPPYFASDDLYTPNCTDAAKNYQIYYECLRIDALLNRRRNMLAAQNAQSPGSILEAYYPKFSWMVDEHISVPIKNPLVLFRTQESSAAFFDNLLLTEMNEITEAKHILHEMICALQEEITWKPGRPIDAEHTAMLDDAFNKNIELPQKDTVKRPEKESTVLLEPKGKTIPKDWNNGKPNKYTARAVELFENHPMSEINSLFRPVIFNVSLFWSGILPWI